jgi:uncharacterized membrane protein
MPMDWVLIAVQWLHVLGGIYWFGGVLFGNIALLPVVIKLPESVQRSFMLPFLEQANRIAVPVAIATITLGFIRGTILGRIHTLADLSTPYGIAWIVGLVAAVAVLALAVFYVAPAARRLVTSTESGVSFAQAGRRLQLAAAADMLGFFVIFTAMISMRFL